MILSSFDRKFAALLAIVFVLSIAAFAQSKVNAKREFRLWRFDKMRVAGSCAAKGRVQDKGYCDSKLIDEIVAAGKDSIPILISQLTDERETESPAFDFWSYTTAGDIAFVVLTDLFTDSTWTKSTLPSMGWDEIVGGEHALPAEQRWRAYVKAKRRNHLREMWLDKWNQYKDRIYWDERERCFKVR